MKLNLTITNSDDAYVWDDQWHPSIGVPSVDFAADVRNLVLGTSAAVSLKPAIQFAPVRTDRPDAGAAIANGSNITTGDAVTHFEESLSGASKFFFRRGFRYKLTSGSFASAEVLLYTAFRACGRIFRPRDITFNPVNDVNVPSYFSLTGPFAAVGVDVAKMVVIGMGDLNTKLEWRPIGRSFNDPLARGEWTPLGSGWSNPQTANFGANTGELDLTDLTLASFQWMELGLAVRKQADTDANSRCMFKVVPAVKYT
jgi:hypothetical protein